MTMELPPRGLGGRLKVGMRDARAEAVVAAPAHAVWQVVADPNHIQLWWPRAVGGSVVDDEEGAGRLQEIRLDWGRVQGVVHQQVTEWQPPSRYGWKVTSESAGDKELAPLADIRVSVLITSEGALSRIAISGEFRPAGARGGLAVRQLARTARRTYKLALKNLQRHLAAS